MQACAIRCPSLLETRAAQQVISTTNFTTDTADCLPNVLIGIPYRKTILSNIDKERTKVANDLLFTKQIEAFSLVDRTNIPKDISNATGDRLQTDDKIAALKFKKK